MLRINQYRTMWIFVQFDLPTRTKKERKASAEFRQNLISDGFLMFQFSIYMRHCPSKEAADRFVRRVEGYLPEYGHVGIFRFTDKQFAETRIYYGRKALPPQHPTLPLEFF